MEDKVESILSRLDSKSVDSVQIKEVGLYERRPIKQKVDNQSINQSIKTLIHVDKPQRDNKIYHHIS